MTGALGSLGHRPPDSRKPPEAPVLTAKAHLLRFWTLHRLETLKSPLREAQQQKLPRVLGGGCQGLKSPWPWPCCSAKSRGGRGGFKLPRDKGRQTQGDGRKGLPRKAQAAGHAVRDAARGRGSAGPLPAVPLAASPCPEHSSSSPWSRPRHSWASTPVASSPPSAGLQPQSPCLSPVSSWAWFLPPGSAHSTFRSHLLQEACQVIPRPRPYASSALTQSCHHTLSGLS